MQWDTVLCVYDPSYIYTTYCFYLFLYIHIHYIPFGDVHRVWLHEVVSGASEQQVEGAVFPPTKHDPSLTREKTYPSEQLVNPAFPQQRGSGKGMSTQESGSGRIIICYKTWATTFEITSPHLAMICPKGDHFVAKDILSSHMWLRERLPVWAKLLQ